MLQTKGDRAEAARTFRFSAILEDRTIERGTIRALDRDAAREQLLLEFPHLLSLDEIAVRDWWEGLGELRDRSANLHVYTKSIAVMIDAALPLTSCFEVAAKGEDPYLNRVMLDIARSLREGRSLSASLAKWPRVFDPSFLGMCQAAERSGRLHFTFRRLAVLLEKRWQLKRKLQSALTYPILISVVALAVFWILVAVVVPSMVPTFHSIGAVLPWPTRVLVSIGNLSTSVPALLALSLGIVVCGVLSFRIVVQGDRFPGFHQWYDRVRLNLPLFGELIRMAILSRTLSTMAALIESGLLLSDVLRHAGQVSGSPVYRGYFDQVLLDIKEGQSFAASLQATGGFPPLLIGIAHLGEESGKLPFLLVKLASLYEEDLEMRLEALTTLIEPVILGIMGIVIGFIVLGTFLPMIQLIEQL